MKTLKSFLRGFGSIIDIWPTPRYEEIELPKYDPVQSYQQYGKNINGYWNNVGGYMRTAIEQTDKEIKD